MKYLQSQFRTHTCAELRAEHVGKEVVLSGWVMRKRDHGGVVFVDLRDNYGITQVVFQEELGNQMQSIRLESVICIQGQVVARSPELINPKLPTGTIEVVAANLRLLSAAEVLPFQVAEDDNAPEASRLKLRFLDLRREKLHANIRARSEIIRFARETMHSLGFTEFQTPILTSSSPEGARDFIVPSRLHPGKFYALPQAPQQFKQLLMVSGFDRYFQIAPCFRDEDARADRSPGEFYQIDIEMSFVEQENVLLTIETIAHEIFSKFANGRKVTDRPFPRIKYNDCLALYGSDKPDLRNPLEISNVSDIFSKTEFKVFANVLAEKGQVNCIALSGKEIPPRSYFDNTIDWFKKQSGLGLAYLSFESNGEAKGSVTKFFSPAELEALKNRFASTGICTLFFGAGQPKKILPYLGRLRDKLGSDFNLIEKDVFKLCLVTNYPQYEWDEVNQKIDFSHNPFSMPDGGLEALNSKDPLEIFASQYDVVCNGYELGSGAIRNHEPEIMYRAFEIAGYDRSVVDQKFGGMIRAFKHGAPPHGGFAYGMDRIVMLLTGETMIRDVIPFPLAQNGEDLLMGAPSEVTEKQLKEANIKVSLPEKVKV